MKLEKRFPANEQPRRTREKLNRTTCQACVAAFDGKVNPRSLCLHTPYRTPYIHTCSIPTVCRANKWPVGPPYFIDTHRKMEIFGELGIFALGFALLRNSRTATFSHQLLRNNAQNIPHHHLFSEHLGKERNLVADVGQGARGTSNRVWQPDNKLPERSVRRLGTSTLSANRPAGAYPSFWQAHAAGVGGSRADLDLISFCSSAVWALGSSAHHHPSDSIPRIQQSVQDRLGALQEQIVGGHLRCM